VSDLFRGGSGTGFLRTQSHATEQTHTEASSTGAPACCHMRCTMCRSPGMSTLVGSCDDACQLPPVHLLPGFFSPAKDAKAISGLIFSSYLNVLLLVVPFGFLAHFLNWPAGLRFSLVGTLPPLHTLCANAPWPQCSHFHVGILLSIARRVQNFVALVPLALLLGEVTEDLALRFGDTIGGLLNATFGNA
jgi:hypothetical protein